MSTPLTQSDNHTRLFLFCSLTNVIPAFLYTPPVALHLISCSDSTLLARSMPAFQSKRACAGLTLTNQTTVLRPTNTADPAHTFNRQTRLYYDFRMAMIACALHT